MKSLETITLFLFLVTSSTIIGSKCLDQSGNSDVDKQTNDFVIQSEDNSEHETSAQSQANQRHEGTRCSNTSLVLARQFLIHQLDTMNLLTNTWLNDVESDEIMEQQKKSLAKLMLTSTGLLNNTIFNADGQPPIEVETSYFRPINAFRKDIDGALLIGAPSDIQPISIKLIRRYRDQCTLTPDKNLFDYHFAVSIGPFIHSLEVIQHLPRELRLSQPTDWHYFQVRILVPRLVYEVNLRQLANHSILKGCPLELIDLNYVSQKQSFKFMLIKSYGLTKDPKYNLTRIFDDYTIPSVTKRLKNMLRFQLNGKSLPLSV